MKNMITVITILISTIITIDSTIAMESSWSEVNYEVAFENYLHNLDSDVDGVVISSMMHLVEMPRVSDEFDLKLSEKLRELVDENGNSRIGYKAYLSLIAINHPELMDSMDLNKESDTTYFKQLADNFRQELMREDEFTTEVQIGN